MSENGSETESCEHWISMFAQLNHYFRSEMVLNGTDYASKELGYAITAAYLLVIIVGAAGNFLTILVVILNPSMRTARNFFILNLALSDFFVCTVTAPMTLYTVLYMFWPFGTVLCKMVGSLQGFNVFLSTFSIAAIALDRYVLVIFPTKRDRQQNLALLFFLMIWITSLMLISKRAYTIGVLATQYAFPLCSIVFAYTRIAHRMKMRFSSKNVARPAMVNSQRRRSVVDRQRRTHLLLISVVAVFAIAWLPLNVFHLVNTFEWTSSFSVCTFAVCHVVAMFSSCLNPLIYAFFNHNFRTEFVALFDKAGLGKMGGPLPPPSKACHTTAVEAPETQPVLMEATVTSKLDKLNSTDLC